MAYSQTLDQKRRETLRRQLYGKEVIRDKKGTEVRGGTEKSTHSNFSYTNQPEFESPTTTLQSPTYLNHDLARILIYSAVAMAVQFILFFAINSHLVKLPI